MKKIFLFVAIGFIHCSSFAQSLDKDNKQFMLIVRYKMDMPSPDTVKLKDIGQKWGLFLSNLAKDGKLVTGLRPGQSGRTISGNDKTTREDACVCGGTVVSSLIEIKAANLDDATMIALKCPIYDLGGSVEIREVMNATGN